MESEFLKNKFKMRERYWRKLRGNWEEEGEFAGLRDDATVDSSKGAKESGKDGALIGLLGTSHQCLSHCWD